MENIDTEKVKTPREELIDMYSQRHPDRNFGDEGAFDDLVGLVVSDLKKYDQELEESRVNNKKVVDLFNKDPRTSGLLLAMASGEDPITYLLDTFGPDIMDALQSEEGKAKIAESNAKYIERKATEEAGEKQRMENYEKSISELVAYAQEKGLTDEQAVELFTKINQIGFDAIEGIYTHETFDMAYNALNYDKAVDDARKEGERDGRNAKISERLAKVQKPADMPPAVGGQGAAVPEPKAKQHDPFFDGIRDEIKRGYGNKSAFSKR